MKGSPALRTVVVLLLLTAVFYPVWRVISRGDRHLTTMVSSADNSNHAIVSGTLRIKTAPAPQHLEVTSEGKVVVEVTNPNGQGNVDKELSLPAGSDLLLRAEWADDRPHALHAEFLPSGTNATVSRDYWAGHNLEDVLSLP